MFGVVPDVVCEAAVVAVYAGLGVDAEGRLGLENAVEPAALVAAFADEYPAA